MQNSEKYNIILDEKAYVCYNKRVMGKCIKSIVLSVIAAIFAVTALSSPVFATPDTGNTDNTDTTVVTDEPNDVDNPTDSDNDNNTDGEEEDEESSTPSCYDQVGSLGWIICPGAGLFGNVIDGAYDLLTQIIEVNPIPTDNTSPTYVVWAYFKDITNSLFIIFLLVIILSQLTGFGINNYGIKKALPRIIISAILVNLSYIICTLAVDLSNILGNAFQAFFVNVQDIAIQNGTISDAASTTSVAGIVAAMLGIGTVGTIAAFTAFGGASGVLWMLLPILLSGLIAVISAVVTMAARQALIYLLVMISPLALIAYMLPNTEKWYKKWYATLAQMLFFYPMFSILYGASQLAGLVIITSATNWLGVVLGIAVKILPLFLSIPLMRMSNSVLGKVSGVIDRATRTPMGALGRYSASQQIAARARKQRVANPIAPSTRLAQYLDKRRALRESDIAESAAMTKLRNEAYVKQKWCNHDGTVSKRGFQHIINEQDKMRYSTIITNAETDIDEGFKTDGTDRRVRTRDLKRMRAINDKYDNLIVDSTVAESRKRVVTHNNMEHRVDLIQQHVKEQGDAIHQRVLDAFNIDTARYDTLKKRDDDYNAAAAKVRKSGIDSLTAEERTAYNAGPLTGADKEFFISGTQAINYTMADAIASRRKLNNEATSVYFELYDDSPAGTIPGDALTAALENGDANSAKAAIQVMAKRGDHKDIMDIFRDGSKEIVENANDTAADKQKKIRFQKELNDACLGLKDDNQILWAWAKSNMIRRGKYNHAIADDETPVLDAFIDFNSFVNGSVASEEERGRIFNADGSFVNGKTKADYDMINMETILTNVRKGTIFSGADRTMYNYFPKAAAKGQVDAEHYYFTATKHLRASASCGQMDGEQLASFNNFFTMGFSKDGDNELFEANRGLVYKKLKEYFKDMNASQLTGLKTATLMQFNDAMIALDEGLNDADVNSGMYGADAAEIMKAENRGTTSVDIDGKEVKVSNLLLNLLKGEINQLNKSNSINSRSGMNIAVRKMLNIKTDS